MRIFILFLPIFGLCSGFFAPLERSEFDEKKANLGVQIYRDNSLSEDKISCETCHNLYLNKTASSKNAPSVLNAARHRVFEGASSFEERILLSIKAKNELNQNARNLVAKIKQNSYYRGEFRKIYGEFWDEFCVADTIAHYLKSIFKEAKFDKFLRSEYKLNEDEMNGYRLFLSLGCALCHNGENLGANGFFKEKKIASLRNNYKNDEQIAASVKNHTKKHINYDLGDEEALNLVEFIKSLRGEFE